MYRTASTPPLITSASTPSANHGETRFPPPSRRLRFLPWLLTPRDASSGHRTARCVFSSRFNRRSSTATEITVRDSRWVISSDDGTAAWLLTPPIPDDSSGGVFVDDDPLAGSAKVIPDLPVPPFQDEKKEPWVKRASGFVYSDGTIFIHGFARVHGYASTPSYAAILLPGTAAPTFLQTTSYLHLNSDRDGYRWCFAYHKGKIVRCHHQYWRIKSPLDYNVPNGGRVMKDEPGKMVQSSYFFESRGELLWAMVQVKTDSSYSKSRSYYGYLEDLAIAWSVSVYALEDAEGGGEPQWVKMDGKSFADRILFLGRPNSFAMDAVALGMSGDGCAYFVDRRQVDGGEWSNPRNKRCRVFRYSFREDKSELVEKLPARWQDEACMWLTPQPTIASNEEIRRKLWPEKEPQHHLGAPFRIYVGNLPRKVDSYQVRQFFREHGKVTEARVMCNKKTRHSRGFGFVTMAATVDDEPAHVLAKLQGLSLDGRPLRVKFADQEE
ncbi:hypothetical protein PR202_ga24612 [Eleusine coracana subsp. coracana]|uniref:RRM domain-containing protein n=1 Tax=Eleusine coracana subsp. coracana TaxID=191504 RepID=A0AAV5D8T8_ELECO|nr:hypothetical protein QOZ80_9AG0676960 [Eleusine coracana subsp. coracana]GJN06843.1 hypothetical protein PR202_ga24612 [Eleusine coracana subsp. coracana]